ncbi:acyltransferase family protein [Patulibacter minatonensis]|uniref:acyltransferase family protein n=1 Tax=Patulibacter minatonensis TaxID=298163 RepID=UPI00047DB770|nr:acyltransferase [Patulibacter minatonensis]
MKTFLSGLLHPDGRLEAASKQGRSANNFDLLRLFGATAVLFAHSFALTITKQPQPLNLDWGSFGVLIFFSISGFLIARSWAYEPKLLPFLFKRALRLWPALLASLVICALVLGPLVTNQPFRIYIDTSATKQFILQNATLQTNYVLPGVFTDNVYPNAVNGSLWTLPLEFKAYLFVAILGLVGFLRPRFRLVMVPVAILGALLVLPGVRDAVPGMNHLVAMLSDIQASPAATYQAKLGSYDMQLRPFAAFMIGAGMFAAARWIPMRWSIGAVVAIAWLCCLFLGSPSLIENGTVWCVPYLVLLLAYRTHHLVRLPKRMGDYSYGLYVWAFPVQQTVSHVLDLTSGWAMFAISLPLTAVLAVLSWHLIEAPALTLKNRLNPPLASPPSVAAHPDGRAEFDPATQPHPAAPAGDRA